MYLYESDIYNDEPLVAYLENFVAPSDCDRFIEYARPRVQSSEVISKTDGTLYRHSARTSSDFFMDNHYEPNATLRNMVAEFFNKDVISFEDTMVIRYQKGEQYKPHVDYFLHGVSGIEQRVATAICYLNDVEEGGATTFPLLDLSFKPKKGSLIYFEYNYTPEINRLTTHAGEPIVDDSEKWIMTIWMRDTGRGFDYSSLQGDYDA
jgi:prolyl 4-hydroxylase